MIHTTIPQDIIPICKYKDSKSHIQPYSNGMIMFIMGYIKHLHIGIQCLIHTEREESITFDITSENLKAANKTVLNKKTTSFNTFKVSNL